MRQATPCERAAFVVIYYIWHTKEEPDMGQQITDQIAFLTEARTALEELGVARDREKQLKQDEGKWGKTLDGEKRALEETVNSTVKKRRDAISTSYDEEIEKAQDKLKKARVKREKAKNQRMERTTGLSGMRPGRCNSRGTEQRRFPLSVFIGWTDGNGRRVVFLLD